jgi:hypothetical protein
MINYQIEGEILMAVKRLVRLLLIICFCLPYGLGSRNTQASPTGPGSAPEPASLMLETSPFTSGYEVPDIVSLPGSRTDRSPLNTPVWWDEVNQELAKFGEAVRSAGDVNGDGYEDVLVGALSYDQGVALFDEGGAWLYYGSSTGLSVTNVLTITPPYMDKSGFFGWAVASAGNVNGDAYDDIMVSLLNYDDGFSDNGAVYVWYGAENGPEPTYDWMAMGDATFAHLGWDIGSAGDVNGDGYDDIIVGAWQYDTNLVSHAYVWHGSENGLDPNGTRPFGTPANADWLASAPTGVSGRGYGFGTRVGTAGDVNGDSYDDVFVGAPLYTNGQTEEGVVFVWYGSNIGLGEDGNVGNADWLAESDQAGAKLSGEPSWAACGAGTVGDVNQDGYDDFIAGSHDYDTGEGLALLWFGSENGLDPDGSRPIGNPQNANWQAQPNQSGAVFGFEFGERGDFNGDDVDDILVSARTFDITGTTTITDSGGLFIWFGSALGPGDDGTPGNADWLAGTDQIGALIGHSVDWAGDVDGDGFDDVFAGAPWYSNVQDSEGRVFLFSGEPDPIDGLLAFNNSPTLLGETTTLSATISAGTMVTFSWDTGFDIILEGQVISYTYEAAGVYTATVTAQNMVGIQSATTQVNIFSPNWLVYLPVALRQYP